MGLSLRIRNESECARATDSDLESGLSEATVILTAFSVRACVVGPER